MAQGRSTKIISMIRWIRTSRFSIKKSLERGGGKHALRFLLPGGGRSILTTELPLPGPWLRRLDVLLPPPCSQRERAKVRVCEREGVCEREREREGEIQVDHRVTWLLAQLRSCSTLPILGSREGSGFRRFRVEGSGFRSIRASTPQARMLKYIYIYIYIYMYTPVSFSSAWGGGGKEHAPFPCPTLAPFST